MYKKAELGYKLGPNNELLLKPKFDDEKQILYDDEYGDGMMQSLHMRKMVNF